MSEKKGLTYDEIMELYHNGTPLMRWWLHEYADKIMEKEKPEKLI